MRARGVPDPFFPSTGFWIEVTGGVPPYTYDPLPAPPNPPGVEVTPQGLVTVEPPPPPGTMVRVNVSDSAEPPQMAVASSTSR